MKGIIQKEIELHTISFCVSFLSRVDELNKLACPQWMGLS